MSTATIHWGPTVGPGERRALEPLLRRLEAARGADGPVSVVGAPAVADWRAIADRPRVVFTAGQDPNHDPLLAAVVAGAELVVGWEEAPRPGGAPWLALPRPAPTAAERPIAPGVATCGDGDSPAAWAIATWHDLLASRTPPLDPAAAIHAPVRVVSGRPADAHARLVQALADGAAVVAVEDAAGHLPADLGPALRCADLLEAAEALELLAGAPRLARALGRMGRDHVATMPDVDTLARAVIARLAAGRGAR